MNQHRFDTAIHLEPVDGEPSLLRGHTTEDYWNMVGPFGGTTAATLLNAVMRHPERQGEPVALTVNYAGPLAAGEFEIEVHTARTNRTNQHWTLVQRQGEEVVTTATAVTAMRRDTWTDTEAERPEALSPDRYQRYPAIDGINWSGSYDIRFVEGEIPGPDAGTAPASRTTLWVRDEPPRPLDYCALASMTDCFYPRPFLRHGTYLPAGTVSLTIHFLADQHELEREADAHILGTAFPRRFGRSYYDQTSELWTADGQLLAAAHQTVYFKV